MYLALVDGRLHLAGVALLGSQLTEANQDELIAAAAGKSKRQIEQLLADRQPKPDAPTRMRPVPQRQRAAPPPPQATPAASARPDDQGGVFRDQQDNGVSARPDPAPEPAPERGRGGRIEPLGDKRYKVQFMASAELVAQLDLAADLLSHRMPVGDLAVVVQETVAQLCDRLMKERFGGAASRAPRKARKPETSTGPGASKKPPRKRLPPHKPTQDPVSVERPLEEQTSAGRPPATAPGRHVPMAVRKEIFERDGHRCTFVDPATGRRCSETRFIELHHIKEWGRYHSHDTEFITLRCHAHNDLAARLDYGEEHMQRCKASGRPPP